MLGNHLLGLYEKALDSKLSWKDRLETARELGFDKTYIPSEHIGLYEKYGYRYLKDIVNYGGDTDRLYVKEL